MPAERNPPTPSLADLFRLDGRVAWISGAAGHLGAAMTTALLEAGAHVYVSGRRRDALEDLAEQLSNLRAGLTVLPMDVTDPQAVTGGFEEIRADRGRLDVLVNNAYSGPTGDVDSTREEDFASSFEVTVTAAFRTVRESMDLLKAAARIAGQSSIINISSMYGLVSPDPSIYGDSGMDSPPHYGAAKAALLQMTRYLAVHLAPFDVRVNSVTPGPIPSPGFLSGHQSFRDALKQKVPLGRVGLASELRGPVLFLASDASSFVTGSNLTVDGGWTAW